MYFYVKLSCKIGLALVILIYIVHTYRIVKMLCRLNLSYKTRSIVIGEERLGGLHLLFLDDYR